MNKILIGLGVVVSVGLVAGLAYVFLLKPNITTTIPSQPENQMEMPMAPTPTPVQPPTLNVLPPASVTTPMPMAVPTPAPAPKPTPVPAPAPAPAPAPVLVPSAISVQIAGFAFSPASLTVKKGTKVTWTNNDSATHTVTGNNGGPNSQFLSQGATYSFTFNTVGTFPYHCGVHPSMTATIQVTE